MTSSEVSISSLLCTLRSLRWEVRPVLTFIKKEINKNRSGEFYLKEHVTAPNLHLKTKQRISNKMWPSHLWELKYKSFISPRQRTTSVFYPLHNKLSAWSTSHLRFLMKTLRNYLPHYVALYKSLQHTRNQISKFFFCYYKKCNFRVLKPFI